MNRIWESKAIVLLIAAVLICGVQFSYCQLPKVNYVNTDTSHLIGVKLLSGSAKSNAKYIKRDFKGKILTYTTNDLTGYGFRGGSVFRRFNIRTGQIETAFFLERISHGRYDLFYLPPGLGPSTFYIINDSIPLTGIPNAKRESIEFMNGLVQGCPHVQKNFRHVRMTRGSMGRFFDDLQTCSEGHQPRIRYGLSVGLSIIRFVPRKDADLFATADFTPAAGLEVAMMGEYPLGRTNWSVTTSPALHKYKGSTVFKAGNVTYDCVIDQWRLELPLAMKYSFMARQTVPFIEAGPSFGFRLGGTSELYKYTSNADEITIDYAATPFITDYQAGVSLAAGATARYDENVSFLFRIRYSYLAGINKPLESLNVGAVVLSVAALL